MIEVEDLDFDNLFDLLESNLIGLWRFKKRNEKTKWCATFVYNGHYYDVDGYDNPKLALQRVFV